MTADDRRHRPGGRRAARDPARARGATATCSTSTALTPPGARARHGHDRRDARGPRPPDPQGARPSAAPAVTILFYEASTRTRVIVRGRGQEPVGRRRQHRRLVVVGVEGRVARGHGAHDRGAGRGHARHAPLGVSGAPYLAAEVFGGSVLNGGDGWHAHPIAGAARPVHAARRGCPAARSRGARS